MVQHPTQARLVGKHPPLRPQEATRDPQRSGMPVIPSYPRANKPDRRGMIMRRQGIPAPFVQMERAPTRHPRLNPGLGKKPFIRKRSATKEIGRAAWRARIAVNENRREISRSRPISAFSGAFFPVSVSVFSVSALPKSPFSPSQTGSPVYSPP